MLRNMPMVLVVILAVTLGFGVGVVRGDVLYRETFGSTEGVTSYNTEYSDVDWQVYWGKSSAAYKAQGWADNKIYPARGLPQDLENVNAGTTKSIKWGYLRTLTKIGGPNVTLAYTDEYPVDRTASDVTSISWYDGSGQEGDLYHGAIQIGGKWYASSYAHTPPVSTSSGGFAGYAEKAEFAFSTDASAWRDVDFLYVADGNSSHLTLGDVLAAPLPDGDITAFGVLIEQAKVSMGATARFDTFEINGALPVAEPAGLSLVGLALLGLHRKRRGA